MDRIIIDDRGPTSDGVARRRRSETLWGLGGADELVGLRGDDLLIGGAGRDDYDGGVGTDTCTDAETSGFRSCES